MDAQLMLSQHHFTERTQPSFFYSTLTAEQISKIKQNFRRSWNRSFQPRHGKTLCNSLCNRMWSTFSLLTSELLMLPWLPTPALFPPGSGMKKRGFLAWPPRAAHCGCYFWKLLLQFIVVWGNKTGGERRFLSTLSPFLKHLTKIIIGKGTEQLPALWSTPDARSRYFLLAQSACCPFQGPAPHFSTSRASPEPPCRDGRGPAPFPRDPVRSARVFWKKIRKTEALFHRGTAAACYRRPVQAPHGFPPFRSRLPARPRWSVTGRESLPAPLPAAPARHAPRAHPAAEAGSAVAEAGLSWRGGVAGEAGKRGAILVPAPGRDSPPSPRQDSEPPPGRARGGVRARGAAGRGPREPRALAVTGAAPRRRAAPACQPVRPLAAGPRRRALPARAPMRPEPPPAARPRRWRAAGRSRCPRRGRPGSAEPPPSVGARAHRPPGAFLWCRGRGEARSRRGFSLRVRQAPAQGDPAGARPLRVRTWGCWRRERRAVTDAHLPGLEAPVRVAAAPRGRTHFVDINIF